MDNNIDGKEWRDFTSIRWILDKEILVLEEKGWVGGKKGNLETDETNTIEKN